MSFDQFSFELLMAGIKAIQRKLDSIECVAEKTERLVEKLELTITREPE